MEDLVACQQISHSKDSQYPITNYDFIAQDKVTFQYHVKIK